MLFASCQALTDPAVCCGANVAGCGLERRTRARDVCEDEEPPAREDAEALPRVFPAPLAAPGAAEEPPAREDAETVPRAFPAPLAVQGAAVTLHIYDVSTVSLVHQVNSLLYPLGTGAFHAAVEVYEREYSYGFIEVGTGVFDNPPRGCHEHQYRQSVDMGCTSLSRAEVEAIIQRLSQDWPGTDYDLLRHNCCVFSNTFCHELGVGAVPAWVSRLAAAGATVEDGVLGVVTAAKSAAIIAAAKAGEIDERYHITGTVRAEARHVIKALKGVDARFHLHEHVAEAGHKVAGGARRLEENAVYAAAQAMGRLREAEEAAAKAAEAEAQLDFQNACGRRGFRFRVRQAGAATSAGLRSLCRCSRSNCASPTTARA